MQSLEISLLLLIKKYKDQGSISFGELAWRGQNMPARNLTFRSFEDARAFVRALKLKNRINGKCPEKCGKKPPRYSTETRTNYRNHGWNSYGDWLGYKEYTWSVSKIKELLQSLKQSGMIYEWKWKKGGLPDGRFNSTTHFLP